MRIRLVLPVISSCVLGCPSAPPAASSGVTAPSATAIASAKPTTAPSSDTSASAAAIVAELDKMHVATLGVITSPSPSSSSSSTAAPASPEVQVGGLQGADAIPGAAAVVAKTRSKFKQCYAKALADDPNEAGKVQLSVVVRANGDVDELKVVSSSVSKSLESCLVGAASFMTFAKPTNGAPTLSFSIVMLPKG